MQALFFETGKQGVNGRFRRGFGHQIFGVACEGRIRDIAGGQQAEVFADADGGEHMFKRVCDGAFRLLRQNIAARDIGGLVILEEGLVQHDQPAGQVQAGAGHGGQHHHRIRRQPRAELCQRRAPAGVGTGGAGHPFDLFQERRPDGGAFDLGYHPQRVILQRARQPEQRHRRHHQRRGQHPGKAQPPRAGATAFDHAAQGFDGVDHLSLAVGDFQRFTGVAVGVENRRAGARV